jgi:hypothetical protein
MRTGLVLGFVSMSLFTASFAFAHGDEPEHKPAEGEQKHEDKAEKHEGHEGKEEKEEEAEWEVTGDFVVGSTTTDIVTAGPPGRREGTPENTLDSSRVTVLSFLIGLEHPITERVTVGARIPFMDGNITSRNGLLGARNGIFIAGNLELGATYKLPIGSHHLELTMELGLPTGSGVEQPSKEEIEAEPTKTYQYNRIDKAAVMRATSWSRGQLDSGLYEPGRIGITPKIVLPLDFGKLAVRPMVKVENLIDVTGDAGQSYVGEIVGGVRVGYRVHEMVEPGLSAWANILYTKAEINDPSVIVLNPYVRFHLGHVKPYVGAILPVFGHLVDDKAYGINAGAVAEF